MILDLPRVRVSTDPGGQTEAVGGTDVLARPEDQWVTLVWNDPVNLMTYVAYVFESYFGYPPHKAEELMLRVHHEGRTVVSTGGREHMERDVQAMHGFGLWATMQRAGDA